MSSTNISGFPFFIHTPTRRVFTNLVVIVTCSLLIRYMDTDKFQSAHTFYQLCAILWIGACMFTCIGSSIAVATLHSLGIYQLVFISIMPYSGWSSGTSFISWFVEHVIKRGIGDAITFYTITILNMSLKATYIQKCYIYKINTDLRLLVYITTISVLVSLLFELLRIRMLYVVNLKRCLECL